LSVLNKGEGTLRSLLLPLLHKRSLKQHAPKGRRRGGSDLVYQGVRALKKRDHRWGVGRGERLPSWDKGYGTGLEASKLSAHSLYKSQERVSPIWKGRRPYYRFQIRFLRTKQILPSAKDMHFGMATIYCREIKEKLTARKRCPHDQGFLGKKERGSSMGRKKWVARHLRAQT